MNALTAIDKLLSGMQSKISLSQGARQTNQINVNTNQFDKSISKN